MICLWIEKTSKAKTPLSEFKVTTPENLLLSKQAVTSKGISVLYTNLQLNPYPNIQLDLWCSDNLSFQCTALSTWLTNRCMDLSTWLTHQLEKDIDCKVLQFIQMIKIKKLFGYKNLGTKTQQLLQRIWWTRANSVFSYNLHWVASLCITFNGP